MLASNAGSAPENPKKAEKRFGKGAVPRSRPEILGDANDRKTAALEQRGNALHAVRREVLSQGAQASDDDVEMHAAILKEAAVKAEQDRKLKQKRSAAALL